jgi:hypothetical protein
MSTINSFIYLYLSVKNYKFLFPLKTVTSLFDVKNKLYEVYFLVNIYIQVGFGRACAPVRCAHPSFWANCHAKKGRCAPPARRSFAASYSTPKKYIKSIQLGPPTSKAFFTPLDHLQTAEIMKYEVPWPRPSQLHWSFPQYFGVKIMCRCDHTP